MGASGDLAPLSHLALGLMGEGKMWSPKSGWADAKYVRSVRYNDRGLCLYDDDLLSATGNCL